jgi:shikimate kinase
MKKIVLVGYMASGKSHIGNLLSKKLNLSFFDLDYLIESELNKSVVTIFKDHGELFFRKKEHEVFKTKISEQNSFILSLGGGTPCYVNNHELLQTENVISIYLKASISTLTARLLQNKQNRPLISQIPDNEVAEFIAKHLFDRSYYYNQCKNVVVIDNKTESEIIGEICDIYVKYA